MTKDLSPDKHAVIVTISLGVSTLVPEMETADILLNQADKALYSAKNHGCNRVVSCKEINAMRAFKCLEYQRYEALI